MRVIQSMAGAKHGGAEVFFTRLVLALHQAGLNQRVLLRSNPGRQKLLADGGVTAHSMPFGGKLDISTRLQLRRQIAYYKPHVVMSWMNRAAAFCPPPRGRFVHCARLGGYYDLKYYSNCDHLIGNTKGIVQYLVGQGWPEAQVHYLPNFVSVEVAKPMPRRDLSTPEDARVILALGRFHKNKAFDILIEAMSHLPDVYLWLAGEGPMESMLRKKAAQYGVTDRIKFLGWQEEPAPLYAAANLVVCSSRIEPLGNVVLEAWARRRPIIATAVQGPKELIRHGVNGLLVPVDDPQALAFSIKHALTTPKMALELVERGFEHYTSHFSEAIVVRRYMEFFHQVIN